MTDTEEVKQPPNAFQYPQGLGTRFPVGGGLAVDDLPDPPPNNKPPFTEEDVEQLAASMRRLGSFFMGHDIRSPESAKLTARDLLLSLWAMGYDNPTVAHASRIATAQSLQSVTGAMSRQAGNSR